MMIMMNIIFIFIILNFMMIMTLIPKSQKTCQRVSVANRNIFAHPEIQLLSPRSQIGAECPSCAAFGVETGAAAAAAAAAGAKRSSIINCGHRIFAAAGLAAAESTPVIFTKHYGPE